MILPYQHSESIEAPRESVCLSAELVRNAPLAWRPLIQNYFTFAQQHFAIIERFSRFPDRNCALGRASTKEELTYLAEGDARCGQG